MNPVQVRQRYLKNNREQYASWIKIYGQPCSVYRFKQSEIPNVDKARRVFGADRVTSNMTRMEFCKNIKIPVAFDEVVNAHADRNVTLEFYLPEDELQVGDVIEFDFLDNKLEFVVEMELSLQLESLYKYNIRTRSSQKSKEG